MQGALAAAAAVRGTTSPNPWVGATIVRNNGVVAVGATSPPGGAHAEAAAIAAAGSAARGATLYTTLEPCFLFEGKRTPPCAQAIVDAGVAHVVIAIEDADLRVRGRGSALLREAGVTVEVGDGSETATALLRPYIKHRQTGLPYVIAKFAASLDGRIATVTGESQWITGEAARERAHQERAHTDAVLVGSGTVLADNPSLTARPGGTLAPHQPVRIVVDTRGRTPPDAALFSQPGHTIVATSRGASAAWKREIAATGAQLIDCEADKYGVNLDQLLQALAQRGIISIWAEGGAALLGSLFAGGHVDETWAFLAPLIIGGDGLPAVGPSGARALADAFRLANPTSEVLDPDVLVRGYTGSWSPR
jgi:diaminohydroxyphosphoribosylaminopyrimidine deaminase / 5-amino-6-(5-phosphoribosylamino)uracil reductase